MNAKCCDRCKEFYTEELPSPKFDFGNLTPKDCTPGTSDLRIFIHFGKYRLDLCPTCQNRIANFIMNKEEL